MPKRTDINKILIIGSGPIIIGQACEFDYSGTQACKALHRLGYEIVLVNSNPATIMTDPETADVTYIGGEEQKSEQEPLKIWGHIEGGEIVPASSPAFTAQCLRVPVTNGHFAAVFCSFEHKPSKEDILEKWQNFRGRPQELQLPSAPKQFLHYFPQDDMPQTRLHRDLEGGMAISLGRLREDTQYDYKFVGLSHNTLRGAAGGAVLLAELLCAEGYMD